jgi:hypothetical protein
MKAEGRDCGEGIHVMWARKVRFRVRVKGVALPGVAMDSFNATGHTKAGIQGYWKHRSPGTNVMINRQQAVGLNIGFPPIDHQESTIQVNILDRRTWWSRNVVLCRSSSTMAGFEAAGTDFPSCVLHLAQRRIRGALSNESVQCRMLVACELPHNTKCSACWSQDLERT